MTTWKLSGAALALLSAFCLIDGPASALPVQPGTVLSLDFDRPATPFDTVDLLFTFGQTDPSGSFTIQLFNQDHQAISNTLTFPADAAATGRIPVVDWPGEALLIGKTGLFDLKTADADVYFGGALQTTVPDAIRAVRPTPLPSSLPLALCGVGMIYALIRRPRPRKAGLPA